MLIYYSGGLIHSPLKCACVGLSLETFGEADFSAACVVVFLNADLIIATLSSHQGHCIIKAMALNSLLDIWSHHEATISAMTDILVILMGLLDEAMRLETKY